MKKLFSLDYSTTSSGFSIFDIESKKLLNYGILKPDTKGTSKLKYPIKQLHIVRKLAYLIIEEIEKLEEPSIILIEEVNRHKNRLSGKTLDAGHFILLDRMNPGLIEKVNYMDSDGKNGWRTYLDLKLSDTDKKLNKERRVLNKKISKKSQQFPIINKKHLAARYVNKHFDLSLNVDQNKHDNDIADSIAMGHAFLLKFDKALNKC